MLWIFPPSQPSLPEHTSPLADVHVDVFVCRCFFMCLLSGLALMDFIFSGPSLIDFGLYLRRAELTVTDCWAEVVLIDIGLHFCMLILQSQRDVLPLPCQFFVLVAFSATCLPFTLFYVSIVACSLTVPYCLNNDVYEL